MENRSVSRRPLAALLLAATALPPALAESNPYYIGASVGYTHDSNLLQLGDGQAAPAGLQKADSIVSTTLLAGFDQPISRQRVFGSLKASHNGLKNNPVYDNDSYSLAAGLDWQTVDNVSGTLHANADRNLAQFNADNLGLVTEKNVQSTRQFDATLKVGGPAALTFDAGAGFRSVDYSAALYHTRNFRQNTLSLGLHYHPVTGLVLGASVRTAEGRYPDFFVQNGNSLSSDRYSRRDLVLDVWFQPSGASTLYAKLSPGRIRYDLATQRDFSGLTGLAKWTWTPTGKLRLETVLQRDPSQDSYFDSRFFGLVANPTLEYSRVSTRGSLSANYDLSSKVALNASLASSHRSLTRTDIISAADGSDTTTSFTLGGTWSPLRWLQVGCSVSDLHRSGTPPLSSNLRDVNTSCYAQGVLQ